MKKILIFILFALASVTIYAQNSYEEVVYLKNGKTVRGVIVEQIPNVQIKIETADGSVFIFPMEEIEKITKEKITAAQPAQPNPDTATLTLMQFEEYLRANNLVIARKNSYKPEYPYLFSLQSGMSYSFLDMSNVKESYTRYYGFTSKDADRYVSKIKNGFFLNASFHYLTASFFGIGVDYNFFRSATTGNSLFDPNRLYGGGSSLPIYVSLNSDERMYLNFIAPSILFMHYLGENKKIRMTESLAPGALFMRWESRSIDYVPYWDPDWTYHIGNLPNYYDKSGSVVTGVNFALKIGLSLEYCITPKWSAGLTGNLLWNNIKKIRIKSRNGEEDGTRDEPLEFSHLDYGLVIRYNF